MHATKLPTPATEHQRRWRGRSWLLAWLTFVPVAFLRAGVLTEPDTFWQVRTGLLMIRSGAIPATDPFSWTALGEPWVINSWGFNVGVAAVYQVAGLPGVALACATLVMAAAGVVLLLARSVGASPVAAATVLLLASPLLIGWLSARPQLVDYIAVPALVLLVRQLLYRSPGWSCAGIGLLMLVWTNLHSAALLGVAILGATAVTLVIMRQPRVRVLWCLLATGIALGSVLVNPYGVGLLTHAVVVRTASTQLVEEWTHFDPSSPIEWAMLAAGLGAGVLAVRRREAVLIATLGVCLVVSIDAIRFLPILVLLSVPLLASAMSHPRVLRYAQSRRVVLIPGAAVGLAAIAVMSLTTLNHVGRPDPSRYPTTLIQRIPRDCRLFNTYLLGGLVLLQRPDVSVSLDSRNDLYSAERVVLAERTLRGEGDLAHSLRGAGCVLVPGRSGLAQRLAKDPAWETTAAEPVATLFVRR